MAYNFTNVNILIVEHSPEMTELVKSVLLILQVPARNIKIAYNIENGFKILCSESPDLVLIDWFEDNTSGLELTKKIREDMMTPNKAVPVIIMAGSGNKTSVFKARDAGISEFLSKPFTATTLANKITRVIERPRGFTISDDYIGPDRRTKNVEFEGEERRVSK